LNSEYPKQNRANENKHSAYRQHIELQGKVHGASLVVDGTKASTEREGAKVLGRRCPVPRKEKPIAVASQLSSIQKSHNTVDLASSWRDIITRLKRGETS
jgi:hypothetical protein